MKSKWKMLIWIFSVLVFTGAFSPKWKVDAASTYVMNVGEKMNLRLTGTVKGTVQWKISNKSVARLSPKGKRTAVVMAKKEGNVRVTAKAGGREIRKEWEAPPKENLQAGQPLLCWPRPGGKPTWG